MSYRASASRGSRQGGQSASAKHAYHVRQGEYLVGREGVRDDLTATGCGNLPAFAQGDAAAFWLAADSFERANAALFIDLQLNLPHELTPAQQQEALRAYCDRMLDQLRLPYSWAIHGDDHVHLMLSERMTDDLERSAEQHFKRYNAAHPERGGAQKTRELQSKSWLLQARGAWAEEINRALVAAGHPPRFDHRSLQVRRDEALERGEWRRAAELDTLVEQHEGPRVAGMRRRLEGGLVDLEDLPEYAQLVIVGNDTIRAENAAYLARVARMSDDELRLMQADDIQRLARERLSGAERIELAELEGQQQDEHASQLEALASSQEAAELGALVSAEALDIVQQRLALEHEQAHGAALVEDSARTAAQRAAELAAFVATERGAQQRNLLAIEREQAHSAALIEHQERERLRADAELRTARAELQAAEREAERLRTAINAPKPACMSAALELRDRCREAAARAERWQRENPVKSLLGKLIEPAPVREARELEEAYMASPERAQALQWQADREQRKAQLAGVRERLPALEQAAKHAERRALELMPRDELLRLRDDTAKRLAERLQRAGGQTAALYGERVQRACQTAQRTTEPVRVAELIELMRSQLVEIEPHARAVDRREVTELVRDALEDLRLATATLSDRGATQAQRERLYALCDATRDLRNPLERAQRDGPLPALGDARAMREQARELRDQGEALTDAIRKQREIARAMRGPRNGPRL